MVVKDITAYVNPKFKRSTYNGTNDLITKYIDGKIKFHAEILDIYNKIEREHYGKFRNNNINISDKLSKLIVNSLAMVNPDGKPIEKTYKNERMDIYRLEFVIEYEVALEKGAKITDLHGVGC